jgi:hypothetical protein
VPGDLIHESCILRQEEEEEEEEAGEGGEQEACFLYNFLFALTTAFVLPSSIFKGLFDCVRGRDSVSGSVCFKPSAGHFGNLIHLRASGTKNKHIYFLSIWGVCVRF